MADAGLERLSDRHRQALTEAVAYVEGRFGPWAVVAAGTILRGTPDANSDIDLYVLHDADFRQRVQRRFAGVPVEVFVNPESTVLGYLANERGDGRPLTAHMLATGVVVSTSDPDRFAGLRDKALESLRTPPEWTDAQLVQERYGAATLLEDALDTRERDPATAMRMLGLAMESTATYWYKTRPAYVPRHKEVLAGIGAVDPELGALFRAFWTGASTLERWDAALAVADQVLETRGFIEWESDEQPR